MKIILISNALHKSEEPKSTYNSKFIISFSGWKDLQLWVWNGVRYVPRWLYQGMFHYHDEIIRDKVLVVVGPTWLIQAAQKYEQMPWRDLRSYFPNSYPKGCMTFFIWYLRVFKLYEVLLRYILYDYTFILIFSVNVQDLFTPQLCKWKFVSLPENKTW